MKYTGNDIHDEFYRIGTTVIGERFAGKIHLRNFKTKAIILFSIL